MAQFVLLSLLLHAFFILLFGSPAGGSREGRAMWSSLDVTIRGPLMESGAGFKLERGARTSLLRPVPAEQPPVVKDPPKPVVAPPPARVQPPPDLDAALLQSKPSPLPEPIVAPRITPIVPTVKPATVPVVSPIAPASADLMPAPRVEPIARPVPVVPAPMLEFAPRPALDPAMAPSISLPPAPIPDTAIPAPLSERTAPAAVPALLTPPLLAPPLEVPVIPAPLLPSQASPVVSPVLAPPVEVAPLAPRAATAAPPAASAPSIPQTTPSERTVPRATDSPAAGSRSSRDSPIFDNRKPAAPRVPLPGTGPRIDLDAARATAREVAREGRGNRSLLPFPMPPPPERKTKEQIAIENARKPDCRDAYKGLGLLAVIPLLANEIGEGSCRW